MRSLSCVLLCCLAGSSFAVPYHGSGPGSSTIAATGPADYSSLAAALLSLQGGPALTGGNWTFLIRSDLTEANNLGLGKLNTGGHRIIIKPDTGSSVTINFTSTAGRANLAIGTTDLTVDGVGGLIPTANVTIDGSNNGSSSRNLTLKSNPAATSSIPVVQVVGDSNGFELKNCTIISKPASHSGSGSAPVGVVHLATYYGNPGLTSAYPDNALIDNNDIHTGTFAQASGILSTFKNLSGSVLDLPDGQAGHIIRNNTIHAARSGIELRNIRGCDVYGNTIAVNQPGDISFDLAIGIHAGGGSQVAADRNIYNNHIIQVYGKRGFSSPICGISVGNGVAGTTHNICNNMIANVKANHFNVENVAGIVVGGSSPSVQNANVYHNSIHIVQPDTERTFANGSQAAGIMAPDGLGFGRTTNLVAKNNVMLNEETTGVAILYAPFDGTLTSDYNSMYIRTGSTTDLTNWQADSGQDANSTYASPRVANLPATGTWTSLTDLHFTAAPGSLFLGTPIPSVTLDIDGQLRSATTPLKGADEIIGGSAVSDWKGY